MGCAAEFWKERSLSLVSHFVVSELPATLKIPWRNAVNAKDRTLSAPRWHFGEAQVYSSGLVPDEKYQSVESEIAKLRLVSSLRLASSLL
jgi:hypothetical protein